MEEVRDPPGGFNTRSVYHRYENGDRGCGWLLRPKNGF